MRHTEAHSFKKLWTQCGRSSMPKVHSAGADRCQRCQAVPSGACSVPALPLRHPQCCPAQATIAPVAVVRSPCAMPICHTRTDRGGEVMQHISSGLKGRRGRGGLSVLPRPPPGLRLTQGHHAPGAPQQGGEALRRGGHPGGRPQRRPQPPGIPPVLPRCAPPSQRSFCGTNLEVTGSKFVSRLVFCFP